MAYTISYSERTRYYCARVFDLSPQSHLAGFKGHTASGTRPPIAAAQSYAQALAREIKPTLAQTHMHTGLINKNALILQGSVIELANHHAHAHVL